MMNCFNNHSCVSNELAQDVSMIYANLLKVLPDLLSSQYMKNDDNPYHIIDLF